MTEILITKFRHHRHGVTETSAAPRLRFHMPRGGCNAPPGDCISLAAPPPPPPRTGNTEEHRGRAGHSDEGNLGRMEGVSFPFSFFFILLCSSSVLCPSCFFFWFLCSLFLSRFCLFSANFSFFFYPSVYKKKDKKKRCTHTFYHVSIYFKGFDCMQVYR